MPLKKHMKLAIEIAKKGVKRGQTPFGCVIVKDNKVIATGHNEVWKHTDITAHAEIVAIRKACKKLKQIHLTGCELYSTVEPCPMCYSAMHWARIPTIIYGASIKDAKQYGFNEMKISNTMLKKLTNSKVKIVKGYMKEDCLKLFKLWKKMSGRSY